MTPLSLQRKEMPRLRRSGFLLLSLTIHLALFAAWQGEALLQLGQSDSRYTSTALHAVLVPAPRKAVETADEPVPEKAAPRENIVRRAPLPETPVTNPTPAPPPVDTTGQDEPAAKKEKADINRAAVESRALGKIRIELARHFHYPRQALRLGWQGEVVLRFRLTAGGRIEAVQVASSSGYNVLDSAAVRALNDVREIGRVMESHLGTIDLQLPVIYRLQES